MKFNVNDEIRVELTEEGVKICTDYYGKILGDFLNENNVLTLQLWEFIKIFGPHVGWGIPPFNTEIELIEKD